MSRHPESVAEKVSRFSVPHVLVLIVFLILVCCALTYILPAGVYEADPTTGLIVPNSYHNVSPSPVSPWAALLAVTGGIASQGVIIALLLFMGGTSSVIIESGAVSSVSNYAVHKPEDYSSTVLIPFIVALMPSIGGLAGQGSLVAVVDVGAKVR